MEIYMPLELGMYVTNMSGMFSHIYGGAMFNQDISGWNVNNVTNMGICLDITKLK